MEELHNATSSKISDFKEVVRGFLEILQAENKALAEYDTDTISQLYEKKSKIIAAYRSMVAYFIKHQEELSSLEEPERLELKSMSVNLDHLIKENEELLKTHMETSQNVMNTIISIAKMTNNSNATSYGAQGRYSPLDNNKNALAVNRTL